MTELDKMNLDDLRRRRLFFLVGILVVTVLVLWVIG